MKRQKPRRQRHLLWLTIVLMPLSSLAGASPTTRPGPDAGDDAIWKAVIAAAMVERLPQKAASDADYRGENAWWYGQGVKATDAFWLQCHEPRLEQKLVYYVDQFGKSGADADLAWMIGCPRFVVQGLYRPPRSRPELGAAYAKGFDRVSEIICRREVERFAANPDLLVRYYQAVFWGGALFGAHFDQPSTAFDWAAAGGPWGYWQSARLLMLLEHATGRDDLISENKETIDKNSVAWLGWMKEKDVAFHLKPDDKLPIWRYDPRSEGETARWPASIRRKPFDDILRAPRFSFSELYFDLEPSPGQSPISPAARALSEIGKTEDLGATDEKAVERN